jgi:copper homeostasis protein
MPILEVIACSVADALAAERGGAHRLEIVRALEVGGLTPPIALVRQILAVVSIPARVMLRENPGFEVANEAEIETLQEAARQCAALGVDGLVLGFLRGRNLDLALTRCVLASAPAVRATFHRAFEELDQPQAAIADLKSVPQLDRILANPARVPGWNQLVARAAPELTFLAGGGLDASSIRTLRETTEIREFHVGAAARHNSDISQSVDAARVRDLVALVAGG